MNHMAITWWASDTMYWLNLKRIKEAKRSKCVHASETAHVFVCVCVNLLGRVSVG